MAMETACSASVNRVCQCKSGYYRSDGGVGGACTIWRTCDAATREEKTAGSQTANRVCQCKAGYYHVATGGEGDDAGRACNKNTSTA